MFDTQSKNNLRNVFILCMKMFQCRLWVYTESINYGKIQCVFYNEVKNPEPNEWNRLVDGLGVTRVRLLCWSYLSHLMLCSQTEGGGGWGRLGNLCPSLSLSYPVLKALRLGSDTLLRLASIHRLRPWSHAFSFRLPVSSNPLPSLPFAL